MIKPLTVLICTHNRAELLRGALESLEGQSLARERFEILVVDNASTDSTATVVAECAARGTIEVRYVRENELGLDAARNTQGPEAPTKSGQTTIINLGDFAPPVDEL